MGLGEEMGAMSSFFVYAEGREQCMEFSMLHRSSVRGELLCVAGGQ